MPIYNLPHDFTAYRGFNRDQSLAIIYAALNNWPFPQGTPDDIQAQARAQAQRVLKNYYSYTEGGRRMRYKSTRRRGKTNRRRGKTHRRRHRKH